MPDFSNYGAMREDGTATKPYTFEELEGAPQLDCRPATSANTRYNNAALKALGRRAQGRRKKARVTAQTVDAARREDADLLSKYCVTGWPVAPVDNAGTPVDFSADNCKDFFLAIPDWMFDDFRNWVADPLQFTTEEEVPEDEEPDADDAEELGNSSQSGSGGTSALAETDTQ